MIKLHRVTKSYGQNALAVDQVSFEVPKGSIACLIGMSGCGKTTTLKMINRLIEPTSGKIEINGQDISREDPVKLRRRIGYVIQKAGLFPHMRVWRNIGLISEIERVPIKEIQARAMSLLRLVGLDPEQFAHRYPTELSGGQQQRVGIARALMADPPVLLMDEPFGALDPITRSKMHQEFIDLNQRLHKTIVIVTHDLLEAFKLGDQVLLMNQGKMVQIGKKVDFMEAPANEFVREFFHAQMEGLR